ncbi:MAG: hypothetical protein Q8O00_02750 [Holophaga sp.]|nr:hypothetical protein [Holophaga sp.]
MNIRTHIVIGSLALLPTLQAQETKPNLVASAGLTWTQGSSRDLTQKAIGGYNLELGFRFHSEEDLGVGFQLYAGWLKMPAGTVTVPRRSTLPNSTYQMVSPHFGLDVIYKPFATVPIAFTTGPAFHVWQVDAKDGVGDSKIGQQGLKVGWRVGTCYEINKSMSVSLNYTLSEWRSNSDMAYVEGLNPSRPAYFTVMAHYHF